MAELAAGVAVGDVDDAIPGFAAVFAFVEAFFGLARLFPDGLRVDEDVIGAFGIAGDGTGAQGVQAEVFAGFPGEAGVFGAGSTTVLLAACFESFTRQMVSCETSAPGEGLCNDTSPSPEALSFSPCVAQIATAERIPFPIKLGITALP